MKNKHFINGQWLNAATSETFAIINPATELVIFHVPLGIATGIEHVVTVARKALDYGAWPKMSGASVVVFPIKLPRILAAV